MSYLNFLDDDYFKMEDFLSVIAESLPRLPLERINSEKSLIEALVDQNKAYGNKIISLVETVDKFYKSRPTASDRSSRPDMTAALQKKITEYEEVVARLKSENENFSRQLTSLSRREQDSYNQKGNYSRTTSKSPSPILKHSNISPKANDSHLEHHHKRVSTFQPDDFFSSNATAKFNAMSEIYEQEDDHLLDVDQLRLKVKYLTNHLKDAQREIEIKTNENQTLRHRLNPAAKLVSPERILKDNETLLESLEAEIKARCEAEAKLRSLQTENDMLQARVTALESTQEVYDLKMQHLAKKAAENDGLIEEISEQNPSSKEKSLSKMREEENNLYLIIDQKDEEIRNLNFELANLRENQLRSPREDSMRASTREIKSNLVIENALQIQSGLLYSIKQDVIDIKINIADKMNHLNLAIHEPSQRQFNFTDDIPPTNELQRSAKSNNQSLKEILIDLDYVKAANHLVIHTLSQTQSKLSNLEKSNLGHKIAQAEEIVYENISGALQNISLITTLIHDLPNGSGAVVSQLLNQLQNLHSSLTKVIQEYPELTNEIQETSRRDSLRGPSVEFPRITSGFFKEKLMKDHHDIQSKLKNAMVSFEKKQTLSEDAYTLFEKEIEKNQELINRVEGKNLVIHRLNLIVTEAIDRMSGSIDNLNRLADSDDAQNLLKLINDEVYNLRFRFKEVVTTGNDPNIDVKSVMRTLGFDIDTQRDDWERTMKNLQEINDNKAERLAREVDLERQAHEKTYQTLAEAQKKLKILDELKREVEHLKHVLQQRDDEIHRNQRKLEENLQRFKLLETDCLNFVAENQNLKNQIDEIKHENRELNLAFDKAQHENQSLIEQLNELNLARTRDLEFWESEATLLKQENLDLREYRDKTDGGLKKANDQIEYLKLTYFSEMNELKESNAILAGNRQGLLNELEKKNNEIRQLSQISDNIQTISNRQLENLKTKDQRISELTEKKREYEKTINDLERRLQEATQKQQKTSESYNQTSSTANQMRGEFQRLGDAHTQLKLEFDALRQENSSLKGQISELLANQDTLNESRELMEDKMSKMNEIVQITKTEIKNCREIIEKKNRELETKQKEIDHLRADTLKKDSGSLKESELIGQLKKELKSKSDELIHLKQEHHKLTQAHEKLNLEIEALIATNKLNEQYVKEVDKISSANKSLTLEVESLKKAIRAKEDQVILERENYEREISKIHKTIRELPSPRKTTMASPSVGSPYDTMKSSDGNPAYYNSLIESKDSEIRRLTQIVRRK